MTLQPTTPTGRRPTPTWLKVVLVAVPSVFVVAMIASAQGQPEYPPQTPSLINETDAFTPSEQPYDIEVLYEVEGTAKKASITYWTGTGLSQQTDVDLPLTADGDKGRRILMDPDAVASLTAQSLGPGEITCRIRVDGRVLAANTSKGDGAVATCSAPLPD